MLAFSQWIYGETLEEYEQGAWFYTDSLGTSSFVVRNCYQSYTEFDALFGNMTQVYHEFPIYSQQLQTNVILYELELNELGWKGFLAFWR